MFPSDRPSDEMVTCRLSGEFDSERTHTSPWFMVSMSRVISQAFRKCIFTSVACQGSMSLDDYKISRHQEKAPPAMPEFRVAREGRVP